MEFSNEGDRFVPMSYDTRSNNNGSSDTELGAMLAHLSDRQPLHPHQRLRVVLDETTDRFGCCPLAIERALQWLNIDGAVSVGRLRRSELIQLARSVHRFWRTPTLSHDPAMQSPG
jgi:hypothetical protein